MKNKGHCVLLRAASRDWRRPPSAQLPSTHNSMKTMEQSGRNCVSIPSHASHEMMMAYS